MLGWEGDLRRKAKSIVELTELERWIFAGRRIDRRANGTRAVDLRRKAKSIVELTELQRVMFTMGKMKSVSMG